MTGQGALPADGIIAASKSIEEWTSARPDWQFRKEIYLDLHVSNFAGWCCLMWPEWEYFNAGF